MMVNQVEYLNKYCIYYLFKASLPISNVTVIYFTQSGTLINFNWEIHTNFIIFLVFIIVFRVK